MTIAIQAITFQGFIRSFNYSPRANFEMKVRRGRCIAKELTKVKKGKMR